MSDTPTLASRDDADEPSEDYYYCDVQGCDASLTGMDFVYGLCPKHRLVERYYLCQTYKSGSLVVLGGGHWNFDNFDDAINAASEPHELECGRSILPGVCASRRVLEIGDDVPPGDASVRLVVRTEGYSG